VIKSRIMRSLGHVAHMGRGEVHAGFLWGNVRDRDCLEELGIECRSVLKWLFNKWDMGGRGHGLN
jgi:hypothetical protein